MRPIAEHKTTLLASAASALLTLGLLYGMVDLASNIFYAVFVAFVSFGITGQLVKSKNQNDGKLIEGPSGAICTVQEKSIAPFSIADALAVSVLFLSIGLVFGVSSLGISLIWSEWASIPFQNYVRVGAAVFLTTFLPGYFILKTFDWKGQFKGLEVIILSYLLSLFIVPASSILASDLGLKLISSGIETMVALNVVLLSIFLIARLAAKCRTKSGLTRGDNFGPMFSNLTHRKLTQFYSLFAIAGVLGFLIVMSYRMFNYPPAIWEIDQWTQHAVARLYERYGNTLFVNGLQPTTLEYPRLFQIYLASLFSTSGAPTTNTYSLISFTNVFGLVALYLLAISFSKKDARNIALISLPLALFSGFGWVYDLWLKLSGFPGDALSRLYQTSISSYDVFYANTYFGSAHPQLTTALHVMAMPALLSLLWLTNRRDLKYWARYVPICLLTALAFLSHVAEAGMFVAILLIAAIWGEVEDVWKVSFATLLGLLLAGFVGALMPDNYYLKLPVYLLSLALSSLTVLIALARHRFSNRSSRRLEMLRSNYRFATALSLIGVCLWLLLLALWRLSGYSSFNVFWDCTPCVTTVPPYMYPSRLGVLALLAIPAVIFALLVWRKEFDGKSAVLGFGFVSFVLGRLWMIPQLSRFTGIEESRWNKYLVLALAIPVAAAIWKSLTRFVVSESTWRKIFVGVLIAMLLSSGVASTILYSEFTELTYTKAQVWNPDIPTRSQPRPEFGAILTHEITVEEMSAIQYLIDNLRRDQVVAVMGYLYWQATGFDYMKVSFLGGLLKNQTVSLMTLYKLKNETDVYHQFAQAKVHFIYLTKFDQQVLTQHKILDSAIASLPTAFHNNEVTIYLFNP